MTLAKAKEVILIEAQAVRELSKRINKNAPIKPYLIKIKRSSCPRVYLYVMDMVVLLKMDPNPHTKGSL